VHGLDCITSILTHFNNCNFSKAQRVCPWWWCFYTETCGRFLVSISMQIWNCF